MLRAFWQRMMLKEIKPCVQCYANSKWTNQNMSPVVLLQCLYIYFSNISKELETKKEKFENFLEFTVSYLSPKIQTRRLHIVFQYLHIVGKKHILIEKVIKLEYFQIQDVQLIVSSWAFMPKMIPSLPFFESDTEYLRRYFILWFRYHII